jgi:predicted acylesterase/phospholipase RssA
MSRILCSLWISIAPTVAMSGCVHLPRQDAVPAALTQRALMPEASDTRYWPELDPGPLFQLVARAAERERASLIKVGKQAEELSPESYLAISSGGDDGAFASGLLVGWTATGDRPQFKVVTGISAGALIAPFVFLGSQYDYVLQEVSSRIEKRDIFHPRNWIAAMMSDGMADARPLAAIIERYVDQDLLRDVARAYAKGRLLLIGTTNLDARQLVVWDMGAIASRGDAAALELFRKVMLASTSIPGVFPPVMIDVEADGKRYQEMHVDGAVMTQVFLFPASIVTGLDQHSRANERERHLYVIRNGRIDAQWGSTERRVMTVAHRALDALVDRNALSDVYRLQVVAQQNGLDLNIAYIDSNFVYPHKSLYAGDYMHHLFQYSYALGASGYPWRKALPDADWPAVGRVMTRDPLNADSPLSIAAMKR